MNEEVVEQALHGAFRKITDIDFSEMGGNRVISITFKETKWMQEFTKWLKKFKTEYQREELTVMADRDIIEDLLFTNLVSWTFQKLGKL